ncbi:[FeFe] hydrogenase H-cluster maturation GTPase HydF [Cellulomonas sp.]|uniref:[FeFe] hydrogenase H-cluster maturation GTPase HydF n=1 Tax=Cellulomonas sp. TaxID=40001 RepID=UPI001B0D0AD6|nr:[FeFe] hydrogenase H-cluster maturation GTPase HydF [Cellulomonas sp.]MBO9553344.1 [FeFe] hydrogenase H-cluster maturation GTPase HydF [Cellulomonas sp.]
MSLLDTPRANRLHIGIYGKRNVGKSSLVNAITGQSISVVSDVAGTTTDPVYKAMELHPVGPVVFIDTAGLDDTGDLGGLRVGKTREAAQKTDLAIVVFADEPDVEAEWVADLGRRGVPVVAVVNKADELADPDAVRTAVKERLRLDAVLVSARTGHNVDAVREAIVAALPDDEPASITGALAQPGDLVLLVMPQDIQAPKGRLILPQVQTLRDLLDKKCLVMSCTTDKLAETLAALARPPKLIITDSQVFPIVHAAKPAESLLTSFSVLFASYKGDIRAFVDGARGIDALTPTSRVLIAESCTHAPLEEDIGRVKIPALLRKRFGQTLHVDMLSGPGLLEDLGSYDLVIHCGGCMFNRRHVLSRIDEAREQGVPITNYGITIAHLSGILDSIALPDPR